MTRHIEALAAVLNKPVGAAGLPLKDILIDVPCKEKTPDRVVQHASVKQLILSWVQGETNKRLISLTGDYGQGKTTALVSAAQQLLSSPNGVRPIPFYVRLSGQDVIGASVEAL